MNDIAAAHVNLPPPSLIYETDSYHDVRTDGQREKTY